MAAHPCRAPLRKAMTEYIAEVEAQTEKFGITPPWGGGPNPCHLLFLAPLVDQMPGPARPNSWGPRPAALGPLDRPFAPYYLGTGTGFALESSDSSAEKDHDGPFGACPTWIFGYSQHDSMQVKSVRITSNLMAPSRALDAAHVLLYRGAVTKRLRSGCDDSSLPNYKSIPPTWAPNSWTDQIRSNTILVAPLIFALAVNRQYLQRLQGHQFFSGRSWVGVGPHQQWGPIIGMPIDGKQFPSLRGFADIVPYNNAVMPNTLKP